MRDASATTSQHQTNSPLLLNCRACGAPSRYNILRQSYACTSCGSVQELSEMHERIEQWQARQAERLGSESDSAAAQTCSQCGAGIHFSGDSQTSSCLFCGAQLLAADFVLTEHFPVSIIPFFFTEEEARGLLEEWSETREGRPHREAIRAELEHLRPIYMPYRVYYGPLSAELRQRHEAIHLHYDARTHLDEKLVATSQIMSNELLDQIEPYDVRGYEDMRLSHLTGIPAKVQDIGDDAVERRCIEECTLDLQQHFGPMLRDEGLRVSIDDSKLASFPILLPVFYLRRGGIELAMNGQTGRIAVRAGVTRSARWLFEPLLVALISWLLSWAANALVHRHWIESARDVFWLALWAPFGRFPIVVIPILLVGLYFLLSWGGRGIVRRTRYRRSALGSLRRDEMRRLEPTALELEFCREMDTPVIYAETERGHEPVEIAYYPAKWVLGFGGFWALMMALPILLGRLMQLVLPIKANLHHPFPSKAWLYPWLGWMALVLPLFVVYLVGLLKETAYSLPYVRPYGEAARRPLAWRQLKQESGEGRQARRSDLLREILAMVRAREPLGLGIAAFVIVFCLMMAYIAAFK